MTLLKNYEGMIDKQMIQNAVREQFKKPKDLPSAHLKSKRLVMTTKRVLCEMLSVYQHLNSPEGSVDRDNDPTFLRFLIDLGLSKQSVECPFQFDITEKRVAEYTLKLSNLEFNDWMQHKPDDQDYQSFLANAAYTGLLYSYPDFQIGEKYKVQVIIYPGAFQPNLEWKQYQGMIAEVLQENTIKDPWIYCKLQNGDERYLRKDWLLPMDSIDSE